MTSGAVVAMPAPADATDRAAERARDRRRRELQRVSLLRRAGVLPEHMRAELTDFPADVQAKALAFLKRPADARGLLIKGDPGVGKSHLAAATLWRAMLDAGVELVAVVSMGALLDRIWETMREGARETTSSALAYYTTRVLLVIEDLGNEGRVTEPVIARLHRILDVRNGSYRPTIATTTKSEAELGALYGMSVASRLGAWDALTLVGPDRRRG